MRRLAVPAALFAAVLMLQGCVSTAIGATGAVVGAGVGVAGKTVGAAKDVVFFAPADTGRD
jgi:hypothetical protein